MQRYTVLTVKDCLKVLTQNMTAANVTLSKCGSYDIKLTRQKNGYGEKKFFVCPKCGSRRTKLYVWEGALICRNCYPFSVYRGIKNVVPGGCKYIKHMMHRLADKNGIQIKRMPFCYMEYEKPKYKHWDKWGWTLTRLQALENMRKQSLFLGKIWKIEVIKSVMRGENTFLYVCDLYDLDKYFYDFEWGYWDYLSRYNS